MKSNELSIKPSFMPKDSATTVRFNKNVIAKLKGQGWSPQRLLDWAIDQNFFSGNNPQNTTLRKQDSQNKNGNVRADNPEE